MTTEEKKYSRKFFLSFLIKYFNLLMSKLQEKPSALKREHPALQKMSFTNFFLCLWVIFAPGSEYGSRNPIESGSWDPEYSTTFEDCSRPARAGRARCRSADRCPDRTTFPSCSPAACSHPPDYAAQIFLTSDVTMQVQEVIREKLGNQSISFSNINTLQVFGTVSNHN
jgi:hypothetical protein